MADQNDYDLRATLLEALMEKIAADRFPSTTTLDMIEEILTPDDVGAYAELLLDRIRDDAFPSIPMLARLRKFA